MMRLWLGLLGVKRVNLDELTKLIRDILSDPQFRDIVHRYIHALDRYDRVWLDLEIAKISKERGGK